MQGREKQPNFSALTYRLIPKYRPRVSKSAASDKTARNLNCRTLRGFCVCDRLRVQLGPLQRWRGPIFGWETTDEADCGDHQAFQARRSPRSPDAARHPGPDRQRGQGFWPAEGADRDLP